MADEAPPSTPPASTPPEGDPEPFDAERAKAKIAKVNSEAKSLRDRLKELEPLAKQAQEAADAKKSADERAAERITAAEQRAVTAEARLLKYEVAAAKGVPLGQADRLRGSTREEIEADAADFLASFPAAPPAPEATPPTGTPKERMRPGAVPAAAVTDATPGSGRLRAAYANTTPK